MPLLQEAWVCDGKIPHWGKQAFDKAMSRGYAHECSFNQAVRRVRG
jgi:hypothetical protein